MKKGYVYATIIFLLALAGGGYFIFMKNGAEKTTTVKDADVVLQTNFGEITLELFYDKTPKTVENFVTLAKSGFYDGVRFHRVIKGFMIQSGDPLTKDVSLEHRWGTGGPGYTFPDEIGTDNRNVFGTISMANSGPNTNGSQFFINTANNSPLDGKHTVFGKVTAGISTVTAIENVATKGPDRPVEDVLIEKITVNQ